MKKRILESIMSSKLYRKVLGEWLPHIRFSTSHSDIDGSEYHEGYDLLRPGHIVLSVDQKKLTTKIIPGEFSHVALCIAKNDPDNCEIVEMTHKNYTESYFFDLCREADRIVILECIDFDDSYVERLIEKCLSYKGALYDMEFDLSDDSLYCCELVYKSDFERRLDVSLEDMAVLERKVLRPDALLAARNVKVVWDSNRATAQCHDA